MAEVLQKKNKAFISWSGNKARTCADFLSDLLNKIFEENEMVFCSRQITDGKMWIQEIDKALKESKIGIILVTREDISRPWLNFEAGVLYASGCDSLVIPIFIDIDNKNRIAEHPLRLFQSRIEFSLEGILHLCGILYKQMQWKHILGADEIISQEFKRFAKEKESDFQNDALEKFLFSKGVSLYADDKSFIAEVTPSVFGETRKKIINHASGKIILAGQSLDEAFSESTDMTIIEPLRSKILTKEITEVCILIVDPAMFSNVNEYEIGTPLSRVTITMNTLITEIIPICKKMNCVINIYFVPLLEIDHAVISEEYMGYRSTKLWTVDGRFKGDFSVYRNIHVKNSEYDAHRRYLEKLMSTSTRIDFEIDTLKPQQVKTKAQESHQHWRKRIKELKYDRVKLHKLYHSQIVNYVTEDWTKEPRINAAFIPSDDVREYGELFKAKNLLGDATQTVLLKYLKRTKELFEEVLRKYDSSTLEIDGVEVPSSGIMIYPSLDLGFPNNVQRLAGGFATGMLVTWKCGTAIVPVDATVNVCSSSVYRINNFPEMSDQEFEKYIDHIVMKATKEKGYSFSFDNGNHFIMIAQSQDDKALYVVMHSSVKEFKDSYMGLYPVEENWFSDSIRTYHDKGRYLRYIKDEDARQFVAYAHKLEQYNVQIHKWYAEQIGIREDAFIKKNTFHHYYMPNDSTIAIGTFVEKPGTILPIFSSVGKDIYLFKVSDENWKIRINGEERCLVPHGWGQVIDNVRSISSDFKKKQLKIDSEIYKVHSKSRITEGKHIRNFQDGEEFFERGKKMLKGEIVKTLRPLYLYCNTKKGKVNDREA